MHESSYIRLLLTVTTLLPQFYRTYTTEDISSFSLLFCGSVFLLSSLWLTRLLLKDRDNIWIITETLVVAMFYGFLTVHIVLQRSGKRKEGVAKNEDNIVSKDFLKELLGEFMFAGIDCI